MCHGRVSVRGLVCVLLREGPYKKQRDQKAVFMTKFCYLNKKVWPSCAGLILLLVCAVLPGFETLLSSLLFQRYKGVLIWRGSRPNPAFPLWLINECCLGSKPCLPLLFDAE